MMRNPLGKKALSLEPSGIRKFFDIVNEMDDVISLGVGEPDFDTPWRIREEGIYSLERGRTFYTSNSGLKELKTEICRYLERTVHVSYQPEILKKEEKPQTVVPPSDPKNYKTVEELYLAGLRIEQFHNATLNPLDYYNEALRRDPGDIRTNTTMGVRALKEGRYSDAEKFLDKAVERTTRNYTNAKDVEPIYYLAVVQEKTGRLKQAKDNYWKSTWRAEFKAPAFFSLAQIACREGNFGEAKELMGTMLWLADDEKAGFVTGIVVPVDGGFSAYSGV